MLTLGFVAHKLAATCAGLQILHRDISLFNIMIGRQRHSNGLRIGVLIDYDYALLSETDPDKCMVSPISPDIWPRLRRGNDPNLYMTFEELSDEEKKLQKLILGLLEAGKRVRGHRTVRTYDISVIFF